MLEHNPYAPPQAALLQTAPSVPELVYAGVWRRLGASIVDTLILLTASLLVARFLSLPLGGGMLWFMSGLLLVLFYHVYLVRVLGGTPGKLLFKMRIAMVDGSRVTLAAAFLRYSVTLVLTYLLPLATFFSDLLNEWWPDTIETWQLARTPLRLIPGALVLAWNASEFMVLLFNEQRRGPQDYMAGTVVIRPVLSNP